MQVGPFKRVKAYALSVSPSSKQLEKLWVMCVSYMQKMELCYQWEHGKEKNKNKTNRQTDRKTDGQTVRQTVGQTGWQVYRYYFRHYT